MKQSAYDRVKDAKAADADAGPPRHLMCGADGCPNRWSSDINGHLCRWHRDAPKERWPEITQQQQWDETERARMRGDPKPYVEPPRADFQRLQRVMARLREPADPKAWIKRLRAKRDAGEPLSAAQRHALAQVEGAHSTLNRARGALEAPDHIPMPDDLSGRFDDIPFPESA